MLISSIAYLKLLSIALVLSCKEKPEDLNYIRILYYKLNVATGQLLTSSKQKIIFFLPCIDFRFVALF